MHGKHSDKYAVHRLIAVVSVMMFVTSVVPIVSDDSHSTFHRGHSVDPAEIVDLGNGKYALVSDYLKNAFGVNSEMSDIDDPIGTGNIGFVPMEIITSNFDFSNYDVYEVGGKTINYSTDAFSNGELSVIFAAKLNLEKHDYICQLAYVKDGDGYSLILEAVFDDKNDNEECSFNAYSIEIAKMESSYIEEIVTYQSINMLQYVVADFDGDGNEEIAFQTRDNILIVGYDVKKSELVLEGKIDNYYEKPLPVAPTDLVCADVDLDGVKELIILRSDYDTKAGNRESTWMGVYDHNDMKGTVWHKLNVNDPDDPGTVLDMLMVSGVEADIDGDLNPELVLGGYLWDNSNNGANALRDPNLSTGELFLAYIEMNDLDAGILNIKGITILRDDNNNATTRYIYYEKNYENYKLNEHNCVDTSIYVTDVGKCSEFTRSVNWSNWTIPIASGCFEGPKDGVRSKQIFFDLGMYRFNGSKFEIIDFAPKLKHTMVDNNVVCNYLESGIVMTQNFSDFDQKDSLFMSYQVNLSKDYYKKGGMEVTFVVYDLNDGFVGAKYGNNSKEFDHTYYEKIPWNASYNPMPIIADYDYDAYVAKIVGHFFTYTDPTVLAVISALPYDADLASILKGGSDNIGYSSYTDLTGSVDNSSITNSFSFGAHGGSGKGFEVLNFQIGIAYLYNNSSFEKTTIKITTKFESSHDSIALFISPIDVYYYEVTGPSEDDPTKLETTMYSVPLFGPSYCSIFGKSEYLELVDNYNVIMSSCLGDEFEPMEPVDFGDSVEGDLSSYTYKPKDPIVDPRKIHYEQSGSSGYITTAVDIYTETGKSSTHGFQVNAEVSINLVMVKFGGDFSYSRKWMTSHSDLSGVAFSVKLSQGNESNYLGSASEARKVLSQYSMEGKIWAEKRSIGDSTYIFVGFTVDSYKVPVKMGGLEVNKYIPDGTDEDDPFNPTNDSIFMKVIIPGFDDFRNIADIYVIQMEYQNAWYDVTKIFDFTVEMMINGTWESSDGDFKPLSMERSFWIKVNGLSYLSDTSFNFRLNSIGKDTINPTAPVIGFKDTRGDLSETVNKIERKKDELVVRNRPFSEPLIAVE